MSGTPGNGDPGTKGGRTPRDTHDDVAQRRDMRGRDSPANTNASTDASTPSRGKQDHREKDADG